MLCESRDAGKPMSLVEQKRMQWAREREELEGLCGLWGPDPARCHADHIGVPATTRCLGVDPSADALGEVTARTDSVRGVRGSVHITLQRRPSLPPIQRPPPPPTSLQCRGDDGTLEDGQRHAYHEEGSSGYASDSAMGQDAHDVHDGQDQHACEVWDDLPHGRAPRLRPDPRGYSKANPAALRQQQQQFVLRDVLRGGWTQQQHADHHRPSGTGSSVASGDSVSTANSSVSSAASTATSTSASWPEEQNDGVDPGRARWGDRGVGVGHLWEPCEPSEAVTPQRLPPVLSRTGAPGWLQRGLQSLDGEPGSQVTSQVLVLSHPDSPGEGATPSCENDDGACRSFLRGQNAPLEADILEERQRRRQKALEHQAAIRQQLEERERRRKEERERRQREERLEEERLLREQAEQRQRLDQEQRRQREKEEQENRRASAMLDALQAAEREAKEQKSRQNRRHVGDDGDGLGEHRETPGTRVARSTRSTRGTEGTPDAPPREGNSPRKRVAGVDEDDANARDREAAAPIVARTPPPVARAEADGAADLAEKLASMHVAESATACQDGERRFVQVADGGSTPTSGDAGNAGPGEWFPVLEFLQTPPLPQEMKTAGMTPLLPFGEGLALVVPAGAADALGSSRESTSMVGPRIMAVPQVALLMSPMVAADGVHGPRLLTPTKSRRRLREVATQTSAGLRRRGGAGINGRARVGMRPLRAGGISASSQVGDRPKWGVNRPGTEYRTQSEKDPNYQQRLQRLQRLHQKMLRQLRAGTCDSSCGDSCKGHFGDVDQSRTPSPGTQAGSACSGDLLSRTYRICRAEEHLQRSSPASRVARRSGPSPGLRAVPARQRARGSPSTASSEAAAGLSAGRSTAASRPGRFSVREGSGASSESRSGDSGAGSSGSGGGRSGAGSSGGSRDGEYPADDGEVAVRDEEDDDDSPSSPRRVDVLEKLSSLRQGLLMKREQLALLESEVPSFS